METFYHDGKKWYLSTPSLLRIVSLGKEILQIYLSPNPSLVKCRKTKKLPFSGLEMKVFLSLVVCCLLFISDPEGAIFRKPGEGCGASWNFYLLHTKVSHFQISATLPRTWNITQYLTSEQTLTRLFFGLHNHCEGRLLLITSPASQQEKLIGRR